MRKLLLFMAVLFAAVAGKAQSITVTAPNGGEIWAGCTVHNITWTSTGTSGFFSVDYSTNGGTTWTSLATNLNASSYSWTIPNTSSTNCLVRVYDYNTPSTVDASNAVFTITAPLILTSPNGGESWQVGGPTHAITWVATGTGTNLTIEYSTNAGSTWTTITTTAVASSGTYTWTIPNTPSTQCLVRIRDAATPCMTDASDNLFTIAPGTPVITVTSPNTAVTWYALQSYTITWTSQYVVNPNVMIEYSTDNGSTWTTIISSVANSGSYNWTVPNTPSNTALVRVSEFGNPSDNDISNVNFTISAPVITVTAPNTAVTYYVANTYAINWTTTTLTGANVKLEYSTDGGATWLNIIASTANSGTYNWTVPNTPSTTCLVRVSDAITPSINDVSNVNFTIAPQSILVTSPNGGENWQGCSLQTITWTRAGTNNNDKLEYSLDGGTTWNTIVASYNPGSGVTNCSYSWTLPNTPSTNCIVRVTDVSVATATDVSNAPFTLSQNTSVIVNTPNGGEVWQVGGPTHAITWAASGTSTNLTIQYSTDNGATWTTITTTANAASGTYTWTIPNTPSTQCLVKIFDAANTCKFDVSNAVFTISPPTETITVTTPNTAVTWYVGNTYTIAWNYAYLSSSFVKLEYSTDAGATWNTIVSSLTNTGSYSWTVPNTPSTTCLVRVSEFGSPAVNDVSDMNFTIASPFVTVTSPNTGAENWQGCSSQTITWTRGGTTNNDKIEYSIDGGTTWTTIVASYNAGVGTSCSYTWGTVPNTPSTNCLIRVTDVSIPTATDVSNNPFTISQNTAIIVNTPNGGEVWQVGGPTHAITWAASGTSTNLTIQYSTDNGTTWTTITTTAVASSGTYTWTIPNTPSTNCLVKIFDASNTCKFDVSNAVFTIAAPTETITVTSPNTPVTWYAGNANTITWTSAYLSSSFVKLEYSTDNGATWITIVASVANSGSYSWTVPNTPSTTCLVRVSEFGTPAVNDVSDVNFTIASPFITVTTPNGGENYQGCSTQTITWTRGGTTNNDKIEYSIDGGTTWVTLNASYNAGAGTICSYTWAGIPNTPSTNCIVRVTDVSLPTATDVSNAPFTISQNTSIILTAPNGGESWQVGGTTQNITWAATGTSTNLTIQYSINNGSTWTTITTTANAASGLYVWTIPNTPSTTCLVKIYDAANTCKFDISDAVFTIAPGTPLFTVTSPNTAVTWYAFQSYTITWTSQYVVGPNVMIEYSTNNGSTWNTIVTSVANSGSYTWTVPNTPSTTCLVRVSEAGNPSVNDISNVNFTIAAPLITVTAPNTALTYYVANTYNITWTNTTLSGPNVKIEYSTDNGGTWNTIVAATNNVNTYAWTVPNTPSTQCLVKVSDAATPSISDVSNVVFTIASQFITVTSPNGGENWQGCSSQTITWTRGGVNNNDKIEYSIDGGATWNTIVASYNPGSGVTSCSYTWGAVPNTPGTNCIIRVTDVSVPTATDVSNFPFSIIQNTAIIVNTPNGGEVWQVGGPTQNITWASSGTSTNLTIQYSTDNGATWTTITTTAVASSGTYAWTIPNTPSAQCLVKIFDASNTCKFDVSNAVFTIAPPTETITVTAPNTAVTWYTGNANTITWTSAYLTSSFVKLEYSIDNGAIWTTIVASVANSGSYSWTVPNTPSTQCLVRVSEFGTPSVNDISNTVFTIANPFITVTSPNGGENWQGCSSQTITWTRGGTTNNDKIEYSTNGGTTWTTIVASYNAGVGTTCSYTWTAVPNTPSTNCIVRVTDVSIPTATDVSNTPFTIPLNTSIIVASPNGGETYQVGGPAQTISWAAAGTSTSLTIQYSTDNGSTWTTITTTAVASSGNYVWTVPNTPSNNCLIKIYDAANPCKMDVSDAVFTILPGTPAITVTVPNVAVTYYVGATYTITWTSAYLSSSFVKIEYSIDNGGSWIVIAAATNNTGTYSWTIPNTPSTQCLVRVSDYGNLSTNDISNVDFTIAPAITVTAPNGGENLGSCTTTSINWTAGACSGNYKLEYSINGGAAWTTIVASYAATTTGNCSYTWTLPTTPSTNCLVRVTDVSAATKTDVSNNPFTISPAITVTAPNFGGSYVVGSTVNITWTSSGVSNFYNIEYSTNGGSTWTTIVFNTNITTNNYLWTVPNAPSTNCLIRVTDNVNTCKRDQSDVVFTITTTAAAITVTAPNGGENWQTCSTQNITWNASGTSGSYNIDYSTNGGSTWTSIATSYAAAGASCSYAWTIPNTISSSTLVRVTDASVGTRTDQSDAAFNITGLSLVATGTATICNGISTPLNASGTTSYSWSPVTGLSSTTIANPIATPATTTTYTVTGTSGTCFNTATVTITVNPVPTVAVSPSTASICTGGNSMLMASGGATYSWLPATGLSSTTAPTVTATPTSTTTYTVTGTSSGCSATATAVITVNPIPGVTATGGSTICAGASASLNASGATTYSWSPGTGLSSNTVANPTASPATSITYTVTGTSLGCSATATVPVSVTPLPNVNTSGNPSICAGSSATVTASGASTYSWSPTTGVSNPAIASPSLSPSATTTYTVTGTTSGCSNTNTVIVTVNPVPTVTASGTATICAGSSTPLSASGATTYVWTPSTGLSSTTSPTPIATPSATTTYTVTGTAGGCTATATVTVTVTPIPVVTVTGTTTICAGSSTTLTAGGATTYTWSPATGLSDATIANPVASPSATTTYTITGATGSCSATRTVTVTVNPVPTVSAIGTATVCAGTSTSLNASGAITYAWTPTTGLSNPNVANPIATPAATTTYTVSGASSGCSATASVTVTVTPLPVITVTGGTGICSGGNTTLNASGATSYTWSPAGTLSNATIANPVASPTSTTTYTVSGTQGSCTGTSTVTVTVNPIPVITVSGTTTICAGNSTTLTASGASTSYSWSPATGLSNANIANPVANPSSTTTYTVTGTSGGCSGTTTVTVTVNPSPAVTASGTGTICSGTSTALNASGATTYSWLPTTGLSSATVANPTATPSATTTYTVTGTTTGCSSTATATVTVVTTPTVTVTGTTTICAGSNTTLTASGATSYSWSPATGLSDPTIANPVASPAATTTYTITGTTGSCTATRTVTVTVNPIPAVAATGTATICAGTSTPLNATGATSYTWSPSTGLSNANIASPVATPSATTTYTVTGTSSGCTATATVTVTVTPGPVANAGSPVTICSGSSTTLNASGGTTYSWSPAASLSNAAIANPVATPTSTTTYTVTVSNGTCSSTATVTVTINALPVANAGSDVTIACGGSTTLSASGGTSYSWSPSTGLSNANIANPVATPAATTTYTVTVSNGTCSSTDDVVITTGNLTADAGPDVTICAGNSTTLSGTSTGSGAAPWVNLATSYNYTQSAGTYTAITGGTVWLNSASTSMDDVVSGAITIPAFKFNNITYTSLYISTNGFVTFGAAPSTTEYTPVSSTDTYAGAISAMGVDLNKYASGTPEIRYQQVGNEFIIQWKDMGRYTSGSAIDRLSFQVRLNTLTNQVNIVYAATSLLGSSTSYPQVGLRGANNTFTTNVKNRSVVSTTGAWINSVAGTTNASTCYYNSATSTTVPAAGTTFTWSLPAATTTYAWSPTTGLSNASIANPVATPTSTTTYTLTVTSGSCTAVDQVLVTVLSGSSVSAGSPATVCAGNSTTLNASGGGTYSWAPATGLSATNIANPVATPAATTNYTVTVSNGSCSFTSAVLVTVNPLPAQPSAITGLASICPSSTNTYSVAAVSGATSYTWTLPSGWSGTSATNSITTTAAATGGTISVTANNGCGAGTAQTLNVNISTTPAQPAAISGSASVCQGLGNTYSVASVAGATSYTWTLPSGWSGSSTGNSITATAGAAGGTITVTANNACGTSTAQTLAVTVNPVPAQPSAISGNTTFCSGTAQTFSVTTDPGATSYSWSLPTGWTGTSTTSTINATAGTTSGNIFVIANNACGSSTPQQLAVTVNTVPAAPASISGSASICPGTANTYTAAAVTGASSYTWTLPGGWIGSSLTSSINAIANSNGGTISVVANNACGTGTAQTLNVTMNNTPAQPAAISGATTVCDGATNTFSVTADPAATSYTWTLPSGWSGTSTTNTISATATGTGGSISVTAENACGTSTAQTLSVAISTAPAQPPAIGGMSTLCEGTSETYSVMADATATSYTWTLPSDWSGTSTGNSITATAGVMSGNITVRANNACGSSTAQTVAATVNPLPSAPVTIHGSSTLCGAGTQVYYIDPSTNATSYTWNVPGTWSSVSSGDTVTVTTDASSGTISVYASNACGNSATQSLAIVIQSAPAQPVLASADTAVCDGGTVNFSVANDPNAASYTWTLPSAWTGTSATNTISAVANTNSGVVTVTGTNSCGTSTALSINVTVHALPTVAFTSPGTVCDNAAAFTLTGGSPAGGTYAGTGVTGGTMFDPSVSGAGNFVITYTYSDANSCSASATAPVQVDLCTGIAANNDANTNVSVYPNPFSEYTTVSIGKAIQLNGAEIHIFDALGKEVMVFTNIHNYEVRIDRKDLRKGMYFYRVINENKEISNGKLIVE